MVKPEVKALGTGRVFQIPSSRGGDPYLAVLFDDGQTICGCPGARKRGRCFHQEALALFHALAPKSGAQVPPKRRRRKVGPEELLGRADQAKESGDLSDEAKAAF